MFSAEEKSQYSRHFILDKIGTNGQLKLKKSKVLVIGAGGLGCPILQYLTAAGVGTIGIIDNDVVDRTNLQRQILYTVDDLGKSKATCATNRLKQLNPFVNFNSYVAYLNAENALEIFKKYDLIIDGSDNFQTRYLSNDAAVLTKKPLIFGAIFKFEGQLSVFNYQNGPTYRCLFPDPPEANRIPNCTDIGVLGVLPGIIGCLQANEALKIICGLGGVLSGELLSFNAISLKQTSIRFSKNKNITVKKLIDYDAFCGIEKSNLLEISHSELNKKLKTTDLTLVDVRKKSEHKRFNIGGIHLCIDELEQKLHLLKNLDNIVVYCQMGKRSAKAVKIILKKYPKKKVMSLAKGIDQWNHNNKS